MQPNMAAGLGFVPEKNQNQRNMGADQRTSEEEDVLGGLVSREHRRSRVLLWSSVVWFCCSLIGAQDAFIWVLWAGGGPASMAAAVAC